MNVRKKSHYFIQEYYDERCTHILHNYVYLVNTQETLFSYIHFNSHKNFLLLLVYLLFNYQAGLQTKLKLETKERSNHKITLKP